MDIQLEKKPVWIRYKYRIIFGVLGVLAIIWLLFSSVRPNSLRYDRENLIIAEVKYDKFLEYLEIEGTVQPKLTLKLNSSENGIIERIIAEEGSTLQEGDTILILDNQELIRTIEDEKDNLEKQYLLHREKMLQMQRKTSELKRSSMKNTYELERLSKQYQLDKEEYAIGIKSKAQLDVATEEYKFNLRNTQLLLEELKHDSLTNIIQIDLMKEDIKREEKKYQRNRERLNQLVIKAPVSGQLSFINVIPGENIMSGNNIGEMKMTNDLKISAKISEFYIDRISVGFTAFVNYQNKKYPLIITKVNPEIKDRQFEVDFVFTGEKPESIRIGKNYRVQVELGQPEDAIVVEKGNFYQTTGGSWIFKLDASGNKAKKVSTVIGRQNPQQYEILQGLSPGDQVIITGYDNFGDVQELILK